MYIWWDATWSLSLVLVYLLHVPSYTGRFYVSSLGFHLLKSSSTEGSNSSKVNTLLNFPFIFSCPYLSIAFLYKTFTLGILSVTDNFPTSRLGVRISDPLVSSNWCLACLLYLLHIISLHSLTCVHLFKDVFIILLTPLSITFLLYPSYFFVVIFLQCYKAAVLKFCKQFPKLSFKWKLTFY